MSYVTCTCTTEIVGRDEMVEDDSWIYFSEGGKHVLFSSASTALKGRLLRVRRDDLVDGSTASSFSAVEVSVDYLRQIVYPLLKPYLDLPDLAEVPPITSRELYKAAIGSGKIPQSRLPSWTKTNCTTTNTGSSMLGTLLKNYKHIPGHEGPSLSVEIKPKAGYLALSPIVDPRHRVKYKQSRFWIQQQLLARGVICKGWTCSVIQATEYDPLDLFSFDEARMKKALSALIENPQNNLTVWDNQGLVLGHEVRKLANADAQSLSCALFVILREESILPQLLRLQLLDVIDGDGAVMIYNHLLDICDGNKSYVWEMLEQAPDSKIVKGGSGCLAASPFPRPTSAALDAFLEEVDTFSAKTSTRDEKDAIYSRSFRWLSKFSEADCIFLLQNWLLSLAMSDVSILITLAPIDATDFATHKNSQWRFKGHYQSQNHLGVMESGSSKWVYAINVVDCDNKPASTLEKRGQKDKLIRKL